MDQPTPPPRKKKFDYKPYVGGIVLLSLTGLIYNTLTSTNSRAGLTLFLFASGTGALTRGVPPTALNARTGELTPPTSD